jgi:hypothetical protein
MLPCVRTTLQNGRVLNSRLYSRKCHAHAATRSACHHATSTAMVESPLIEMARSRAAALPSHRCSAGYRCLIIGQSSASRRRDADFALLGGVEAGRIRSEIP